MFVKNHLPIQLSSLNTKIQCMQPRKSINAIYVQKISVNQVLLENTLKVYTKMKVISNVALVIRHFLQMLNWEITWKVSMNKETSNVTCVQNLMEQMKILEDILEKTTSNQNNDCNVHNVLWNIAGQILYVDTSKVFIKNWRFTNVIFVGKRFPEKTRLTIIKEHTSQRWSEIRKIMEKFSQSM